MKFKIAIFIPLIFISFAGIAKNMPVDNSGSVTSKKVSYTAWKFVMSTNCINHYQRTAYANNGKIWLERKSTVKKSCAITPVKR